MGERRPSIGVDVESVDIGVSCRGRPTEGAVNSMASEAIMKSRSLVGLKVSLHMGPMSRNGNSNDE